MLIEGFVGKYLLSPVNHASKYTIRQKMGISARQKIGQLVMAGLWIMGYGFAEDVQRRGMENCNMETYDSTNDVLEHCKRVKYWMGWVIDVLEYRATHHDESKLVDPEKPIFDEFVPLLKVYQFGSDEYKDALARMGEGLQHHYRENPHHPEHWKRGIDGMALWDLVEMVCDWMAAASVKEGHVNLGYLQERFHVSPQLRRIIENTLWSADMDCINNRVPMEFWPIINFSPPKEKNWTEKIDAMSRERLEQFAINAMGLIMSLDGHTTQTPDDVFAEVYKIGEPDGRVE